VSMSVKERERVCVCVCVFVCERYKESETHRARCACKETGRHAARVRDTVMHLHRGGYPHRYTQIDMQRERPKQEKDG